MSTARDKTKTDNDKENQKDSKRRKEDDVLEDLDSNGGKRSNMAPPPAAAAAAPPVLRGESDWTHNHWSIHKSLADALSSSLANIANQEAALKFPPPSATNSSTSDSSGNENANHHHHCAVVTVTTSGDDNPSSDDHQRQQQHIQQYNNNYNNNCTNTYKNTYNNNNSNHRSYSHHRRDDPSTIQSDELGLPHPMDDRVSQRNCPHALVMARLPPPSYSYTSSSCLKDPKEQPDEPSDGGYAASASSNDNCSSPSVSSSEEDPAKKPTKSNAAFSLFSSSSVDCHGGFQTTSSSSTSSYVSSDEEQRTNHHNKINHHNLKRKPQRSQQEAKRCKSWQKETRDQLEREFQDAVSRACNRCSSANNWISTDNTPSLILSLSVDTMGHVLSYIDPREVHSLLTMPVSKSWRQAFTIPQDLWKVLCISEPFYARVTSADRSNSPLGRYRLLYTSFIRCMKYLARIKDDALHGRPPTGLEQSNHPFHANKSLKDFFAKARELRRQDDDDDDDTEPSEMTPDKTSSDDDSEKKKAEKRKTKKKDKKMRKKTLGHSKLTQNLLGPANGVPGHVNLPWSCAIYSIVNWMHAFQDVEGIQVMCLRVLPFLLEDETQRTTAQRAGLTDIVLRSMVIFPNSIELHTASFHTIVLLARPLGGREGMLFHSAMVNASGIFNVGSNTGKNGIAVMIDSMRRFANDEVLQAMSCWSMVNIALIPSQKIILVKMGGISVAADAMMRHPYNAEVQFRALFALINLVIPSDNEDDNSPQARAMNEQLDGVVDDLTEREILDENVNQITNLVVVAMKNFCSSEAILNRACLVLHNLSLNERYHTALLWTPNCYQMLEWCIGNYRHDQVLQHSAGGTLQRLQLTLATDTDIRMRFTETIRAQQQNSLTRDSYNLQNSDINNGSSQILSSEQQNSTS